MMMMSGHNVWISLCVATLGRDGSRSCLQVFSTHLWESLQSLPESLHSFPFTPSTLKSWEKPIRLSTLTNTTILVSLRRIKNVPITQNTILIVALFIVVVIAILYWFFGTELGCSLRATGCNPNMSRAQGINTDFCKVLGLMISNGLVALSSALLAQYQGFADVNMGRGAIVIGLAAVIIGEAVFRPNFPQLSRSVF